MGSLSLFQGNEIEVNAFLEFPCFLYDPTDISNLIAGFSASSKFSWNIWKVLVHVLLKPRLENFKNSFVSMWSDCNCAEGWTSFGIAFLWDWDENWFFRSCGHCWVSHVCWHIECSTLTASSFRIWNSSAGILSPLLPLLVVMLPKAYLTSHSSMSGSRWVTAKPSWLSGSLRSFLYSSCLYSCHLFWISSASVRSIWFLSFIVPIFLWNFP